MLGVVPVKVICYVIMLYVQVPRFEGGISSILNTTANCANFRVQLLDFKI